MADDVRVVIYDSVITAMNYPGGQVWHWASQRRAKIERLARVFAPSRSGTLKENIFSEWSGSSRDQVQMEVFAAVKYAKWVHEGAYGPIYPKEAANLYLPAYGIWSARRVPFVEGQFANPFLVRAMRTVMADL